MVIYDGIYRWQGWGGKLKLGSGRCYLRIVDLKTEKAKDIFHLRPIVIVVSDLPDKKPGDMTIRSCAGNIATCITRDYQINSSRMLYVEYYPAVTYGEKKEFMIPEKFEAVDFTWKNDLAIEPRWRILAPRIRDMIKVYIQQNAIDG